jgi:hypothetical protein
MLLVHPRLLVTGAAHGFIAAALGRLWTALVSCAHCCCRTARQGSRVLLCKSQSSIKQ